MRRFEAESLEAQLRELPVAASAAFALACAMRVSSFAPTPHFLAERARTIVFASLEGSLQSFAGAELVLRELEASPELDRDDVAASFFALACLAHSDAMAAFSAAQRAYEAADAAAQGTVEFSVFTPEVENVLLRDSRVQSELSYQARDLEQLQLNPEQPLSVVKRASET